MASLRELVVPEGDSMWAGGMGGDAQAGQCSGWPERFSWEERDGVADSFARRGESEARAD